ncbi:MAG TPA: hypothetical protein ENK85_10035 [Saprospiraceae bacterium]|nr:hypothetical protein [Saprospiraceae bacterium]
MGGVIGFSQNPETCNGAHSLVLSGSGTTTWLAPSIDPTWSFSSIVVGNNHKLIVPVGQTIHFVEGGELEVKTLGRLTLAGTLTSCENEWNGVRLRGVVDDYPTDLVDQAKFIGTGG